MSRSKAKAMRLEEELDEEEIDEEMLNLMLSQRRGSADVRKPQSWMQKLNPRLVYVSFWSYLC